MFNQEEKRYPRSVYAVNFYIDSLVTLGMEACLEWMKTDPDARSSVLDITKTILKQALDRIEKTDYGSYSSS
jgi:hypothetical protein